MTRLVRSVCILLALGLSLPVWAQVQPVAQRFAVDGPDQPAFLQPPKQYEVLGISVEGTESETMQNFLLRSSKITVGQTLTIPGDEAISDAIRSLYRLGLYSDIDIVAEKMLDNGVFLAIKVKEEPKLHEYAFEGVKKGERKDLRKEVPLLRGRAVKPGDLERSKQAIEDYFEEKGFPLVEIDVTREETPDNLVNVTFDVDKGSRVKVETIEFDGNMAFDDGKLRGKMKETKERRWWRFWKRETFHEDEYEEDLKKLLAYYNDRGYYDARIQSDTVYVAGAGSDEPGIVVNIDVHEGPQYRIRNVEWSGNTAYTDVQLTEALGLEEGDLYNRSKLEANLYGNPRSTDVGSLYYNRGYVRFSAIPSITEVEGDSLDLSFDVYEGDIYSFGEIKIAGNTKTKDHVIRRNLRTVPGRTFTRDDIQRSLRELAQLGYFNPETMRPDTRIDPETQTVDITYNLEETGGDQLEFSGGWGGYGGLLLQAGITFKNFSVQEIFSWNDGFRMPAGDGQQLSVGVQVQGRYYQNYYMSFTEPWFRGKPRPLGLSLSHSRYDLGASRYRDYLNSIYYGPDYVAPDNPDDRFSISSASLSYGRRLLWPDDYFQTSSVLGYKYYNLGESRLLSAGLPEGQNQSLTFRQSLSRNSMDDPFFPTSGSSFNLSVEIAPPFQGFIQYHKWQLGTSWNLPVAKKVAFGVSADYGFLGSLTGERVSFERFLVGGTPFDSQYGFQSFGRDLVYMRGYPSRALGPRSAENDVLGGTILNKYTSELRIIAIRQPQFSVQPYAFLDAANTWNDFAGYIPTDLYRSAGFGVKIALPILGMLNLNYGYNFDEFPALPGDTGARKWRFQFSLGQ